MKRKQLQQTSMEVTVGAFMLMILLALGFFTIILSRENIFMKSYRYTVTFENVAGLLKGDMAYMHGVDIGRVRSLKVDPEGKVAVELSMRNELKLHRDYQISVIAASVLGGKYISVDPGSNQEPLLPKGEKLIGVPPVDFIAEATDGILAVRKSLEEGGVLKNLETTMTNLAHVSDDLVQGKGTIGKLLKDEEVYNELKDVASNLKTLTDKINKGEGSIGKLVNDDTVYTNVVAITKNLREISGRLAKGKGTIGKLLSEDDKLYNDLADAAASIKIIAGDISKGKGTLGKLSQDDEVYDNLNKLLVEVRATVDDLRETSPVASFSSIFFGAF